MIKEMPGVSIIVGCFMQEKYLEQAYWSAVNQDYDGPLQVYINHDGCDTGKNTSASKARNRAISYEAVHDWIICLDADDLLPSNYVTTLMDHLVSDTYNITNGIAGCPVQFISGRNLARFGNVDADTYYLSDFTTEVPPIPSSALFHRIAWSEVNGYDESLRSMEDFDFWYKLLSREGAAYFHTKDTCLLKNNDGNGKVHRTPQRVRQATIQHMNKMYGLTLEAPQVIQ